VCGYRSWCWPRVLNTDIGQTSGCAFVLGMLGCATIVTRPACIPAMPSEGAFAPTGGYHAPDTL